MTTDTRPTKLDIAADQLVKAIAQAADDYEREHGNEQAAIDKATRELDTTIAKLEVLRRYKADLRIAAAAEEIVKRNGGSYERAVLMSLDHNSGL
jgi:hypothetical protein